MKSAQGTIKPVDGRRARGQANRNKLVAAMIELVREGSIAPTAEQVAARANVALRTVFRHFDDMESLYREIDTEIMQLITPLISTPFKTTDWRGRLSAVPHCSKPYCRFASPPKPCATSRPFFRKSST